MSKDLKNNFKAKFLSVLFWAVISAAFIGPGTVASCTQAGAYHRFDLMWTMVFSIIGCIFLQEATARITMISGKNLGQAIAIFFEGKTQKAIIFILIVGAIIIGCAAYETGNILGAVEGLLLIFPKLELNIKHLIPDFYIKIELFKELNPFFSELKISKIIFVFIIGILVYLVFKFRSIRTIANSMGIIVFLMGIAFVTTFIFLKPSMSEFLRGSFIPTIPKDYGVSTIPGPGILILAIIGTTIVPYDMFLGSSLASRKQSIIDMRFGISFSIILGGIISMAIIGVGSSVTEGMDEEAIKGMTFSFKLLSDVLEIYIGKWSVYIFGFGLFAAGFSSAITSPLASALTASSLFSQNNPEKWKIHSPKFMKIIFFVVSVGLFFGFLNVKPIPVIIMAQAMNGLILPFISVFLLFVVNDYKIMGKDGINGVISNIFMTFTVWITMIIGIVNIFKAIMSAFGIKTILNDSIIIIIGSTTFVISIFILIVLYRRRSKYILNQVLD
jgi:Mn2+/Fe2+ NRAMP family transporter